MNLQQIGLMLIGIGIVLFGPWVIDMIRRYAPAITKRGASRYLVIRRYGYNMSSYNDTDDDEDDTENDDESPATTTPQNSNNAIAMQRNESNTLLLEAKAQGLAALVKAGKVGETEGILIVFGVKPSSTNPKYQEARTALKTELRRLESIPFPTLEAARKPRWMGEEVEV